MKNAFTKSIIILGILLFAGPLFSAPISDPGQLEPTATIIDFESFAVGTTEPIVIDGVTITDDNTSVTSSIRAQAWTQYPGIFEGQYFGLGTGDRGYIIEFNAPIAQFGMGIFDPNLTGNVLRALDSGGNVLEQLISNIDPEFPVGPTGGVFSTFVGFVRQQNDIKRIELIHVAGDWLAIDTVSYSRVVPIPAAFWLFVTGLLSLFGFEKLNRVYFPELPNIVNALGQFIAPILRRSAFKLPVICRYSSRIDC